MTQQTAVEWLIEYCDRENWSIPNNIIAKAKEMEKEQIANAFDRGRFWNMSWDGNGYYEEIIIKGNNE